jgi:hypothetical protein
LDLRELVGFKAVYGTISDENIAINRSNIDYRAQEDIYYEYSVGIGNIFRILHRCQFRGNYNSLLMRVILLLLEVLVLVFNNYKTSFFKPFWYQLKAIATTLLCSSLAGT